MLNLCFPSGNSSQFAVSFFSSNGPCVFTVGHCQKVSDLDGDGRVTVTVTILHELFSRYVHIYIYIYRYIYIYTHT